MEELKFIDYVKLRLQRSRRDSIMGDLLHDMERDMHKLEEFKTLDAISSYIHFEACKEAWDAFKHLRSQYKQYCRKNFKEPEEYTSTLW